MGKVIDFSEMIAKMYNEEMAKRRCEDYEIDSAQAKKLVDAYEFFTKLAKENNGRIEPFKLIPSEINGGVTAYFTFFYIGGNDIKRFCEVIGSASAVSIDATTDGEVCISFTIPGIFKKK